MRLLVLAGAGPKGWSLYDRFVENWRKVILPSNVKVYYYFYTDGITNIEVRGDELHIPFQGVEDGHVSHQKTMEAYKWALANEEFDVILRPGVSSAFRIKLLLEWLSKQPTKNHCFGKLIFRSYLSGCGYAISRDAVEKIVRWDPRESNYDDVLLGKFMREHGIELVEWALDHEANRPEGEGYWKTDDNIESETQFHFRFKSSVKLSERDIDVANHLKAILYWNEKDWQGTP